MLGTDGMDGTDVMRARAKGAVVVGTLLACTLTAGCKKTTSTEAPADDQTLAQDGTDTSFVESDSELLTSSLVGASSAAPVALAAEAQPGQLGAAAFFGPRGCLTVVHDSTAQTAQYHFAGCTGPLGLAHLSGDVTVTYQSAPGKLVLDVVGTALQVNRATADWHAHAEIVASGLARTMTWSAELSGVTARGRDFTRTNTKTVTWKVGDRCFTLDGSSTGDVRNREVKTVIAGYTRCGAACPEAGGKITISSGATTLEMTFDGSANATLTSPKGSTTIPLVCAG
jgi:hypothetical protein